MNETHAAASDSPQSRLAAILDGIKPDSLLSVSTNPIPLLEHWADDHPCEVSAVQDPDPLHLLAKHGRFDLAVVADQLEYMNHHAGEELLGRLRNLHTDRMLVLYQPTLAPKNLRWSSNDFLGMGLRRDSHFVSGDREMTLYSYELATYNFVREWNNAKFWANPENWGKYWW